MLLAAMAEYGFAQCPKCKEATELKEGCKYVYCRCKTDGKKTAFCYHCGRQLYECVGASQPLSPAAAVLTGSRCRRRKQHYSHFTGAPGPSWAKTKDGPYGDRCWGGVRGNDRFCRQHAYPRAESTLSRAGQGQEGARCGAGLPELHGLVGHERCQEDRLQLRQLERAEELVMAGGLWVAFLLWC